jgi:hypothetical protein
MRTEVPAWQRGSFEEATGVDGASVSVAVVGSHPAGELVLGWLRTHGPAPQTGVWSCLRLQTGSSVSTSRNRRIDVSIPLPDALLRGPSVVVVGRVNAPVMRP